MSLPMLNGRALRVVIRTLGITGRSPLEARRLADAMGPALERAVSRVVDEARRPARLQRSEDRVAAQIADAIEARLREKP